MTVMIVFFAVWTKFLLNYMKFCTIIKMFNYSKAIFMELGFYLSIALSAETGRAGHIIVFDIICSLRALKILTGGLLPKPGPGLVAKCYRSLEIIHSSNETSFENKIKLHCKKNFPVFGAEGSNPGIFGSKIGFCSEKL